MSAPTRGPFKACRELTQEWVEDANGDVIADVYEDLHLLAASWEMREALEHARETLRRQMPCVHDGDDDSPGCDPDCDKCDVEGAMAHIDATLAKAQGEGR